MPEIKYPDTYGNPSTAIIHPAREESNVRFGAGVQYDIVFKVKDGVNLIVFPETKKFDLMRRYEWVFVENPFNPNECGWVSLLIPFEQMFTDVEEITNRVE